MPKQTSPIEEIAKKAMKRKCKVLKDPIYTPLPEVKDLTMKVVIVGDCGVGKSAIVQRYGEGTFTENYRITIGADFILKQFYYNTNTRIHLQLWDIAGHHRFGTLTNVFYRYASGAVIVFDVTNQESYEHVKVWLEDLRAKTVTPRGKDIPILLLANKCDVGDVPHVKGLKEFCAKNKLYGVFTTSAKKNININLAMETLVGKMYENQIASDPEESFRLISEKLPPVAKEHKCCA